MISSPVDNSEGRDVFKQLLTININVSNQIFPLYFVVYCAFSFHLTISIDVAVAAMLSVFTATLKLVPRFKVIGGSARENLALQNIQVYIKFVTNTLQKLLAFIKFESSRV